MFYVYCPGRGIMTVHPVTQEIRWTTDLSRARPFRTWNDANNQIILHERVVNEDEARVILALES